MDVYENLKKQLLPTGLYALSGKTAVDCELRAYAEGLGPVFGELEELIGERFIPTAAGYGLALAEQACRLSAGGSVEQRRDALCTLGSVTPNSVTAADLEKTLSAWGMSVRIEEDAADKKVTAHFLKEPACGRIRARYLLEKFCPAHLTPAPDFSSIS